MTQHGWNKNVLSGKCLKIYCRGGRLFQTQESYDHGYYGDRILLLRKEKRFYLSKE